MHHRIGDDVDSQRVREVLGILLKILFFFPFPFPAVADVVVMAQQGHQAAAIVEHSIKVRGFVSFGVAVPVFKFIAVSKAVA